jgi:hypothetical protein
MISVFGDDLRVAFYVANEGDIIERNRGNHPLNAIKRKKDINGYNFSHYRPYGWDKSKKCYSRLMPNGRL